MLSTKGNSMKIWWALFFVVLVSMPFGAPAAEQRFKLYNGEVVTLSEYNKTIELIQNICAKVGAEAYRKYSDGSVCFLGRLLSMRYGTIPTVNTNGMSLIDAGFKVLDVSPEGCRIQPVLTMFSSSKYDLFVVGLAGFSDREYVNILMLRRIGAYSYVTVGGGSRTIPKYEMGERITKEEYLSVMSGKAKVKPPEPEKPRNEKPDLKKTQV